jgi:hypothetical protein
MSLKVKSTAAGSRNVSVQISGILGTVEHCEGIFPLVKLEHTNLKLTSFLFLIQEKAGLLLWWDEEKKDLILPLESRGAFKLETGIKSPEGWDGQIWAEAFKIDDNVKGLLLLMDFDR